MLTLGVLAAVLLLVWLGGFYALHVIRESSEKDLEARLEVVGALAADRLAELIGLQALEQAIKESRPEDGAEEESRFEAAEAFLDQYGPALSEYLERLVAQANLRRAMVLDVYHRAIADSADEATAFAHYVLLDIDRYEIGKASMTRGTVATPYYAFQGEPYKRSYTPLGGSDVALLQLEASRGYFAEIERLRPQLLLMLVIITGLVLVVGLLLHRLLQYTLRAEAAAAEADRMLAVGTLAAGFAHEVRNPLGIIRSYAEGMADELKSGQAELAGMADEMVEEVVRVDALITQFLNFARPGGSNTWKTVAPGEVLLSVARLASKELEAKRLRMETSVEDGAPPVWVDEKALRQVLLNVLLNARDACEPGGAIRAEVRSRRDRVLIRVEDNGPGIAPENLPRIFDPFFTTKAGGTGLGLSLSRNIIRQFGGGIAVQSSPGRGTSVEITLPAAKEQG